DRAGGGRAAVVEAAVARRVNEDGRDVRVVRVERPRARRAAQAREEGGRRDEGRGDDRGRRDAAQRVRQLERRRVGVRRERLHGEGRGQGVLKDVLVRKALVVQAVARAQDGP